MVGYCLAALCALVIFYFPVQTAVYTIKGFSADFIGYNPFISSIKNNLAVSRPNFLYPLIIALISAGLQDAFLQTIQLWTTLAFYVLLALTLVWILDRELGLASRPMQVVSRLALVVAMMIFAPINFLPIRNGNLYFGYVGVTVYHNANIALLKPLALLHFYLLVDYLRTPDAGMKRSSMVLLPLLLVLATLAKPNYAMILLPTIVVYAVAKMLSRQRIPWKQLLVFVVFPGLLVLAWQYAFQYGSPQLNPEHTSVVFWPLAAYRLHSLDLAPKLLLSIVFPLVAALLLRRGLRHDLFMQLALVLTLFGLLFTYCFAETGIRLRDMNFAWCGQIALFLLMVSCVVWTSRWYLREGRVGWRLAIVSGAFLMHVVGGIFWYYRETFSSGQFW